MNFRILLITCFFLVFWQNNLLAQSSPVIQSGLIFPLQEKHVHGSSLVALPNGDMLAAWFYGSGERTTNDVKIMGAQLKKGIPTGRSHS